MSEFSCKFLMVLDAAQNSWLICEISINNDSLIFADATRCNPDPCANGGTCVAADFDFNCQCTSGWGGKVCNIRK